MASHSESLSRAQGEFWRHRATHCMKPADGVVVPAWRKSMVGGPSRIALIGAGLQPRPGVTHTFTYATMRRGNPSSANSVLMARYRIISVLERPMSVVNYDYALARSAIDICDGCHADD